MRRLTLILALILVTPSVVVRAQSNPRQLADANRTAMDAYNNLEVEVAKATLERAVAGAESNGLSGSGLARTYANLGVVEVGGFSDSAAALEAFIRALQEDPTVEPDPLVSTPEVQQVFAQAKRKVGQAGTRSRTKAPTSVGPTVVEGNLEHVPAAEQLKNTAIPVYVAASNSEIASMKVFYRSVGMPKPKSAALRRTGEGFSYEIPCGDVFEPSVEYFVLAYNADGDKIGNAGTPEQPVVVPVVSVRSQPAPSLPGEVAPSQCGGGEAPFVAATGGRAYVGREGALGDTCNIDDDCGEGLACYDNFCGLGERGSKKSKSEGDGEPPRFYFDVGVGVAAVLVTNKTSTDGNPPDAVMEDAERRATENFQGPERMQAAQTYASAYGWNCVVTETADMRPAFGNCKTAVGGSGFVTVPVLYGTLGYYVTERIGVAVSGRYQFKHGQKSNGLGVGLRADILLTEPSETGFHAGLVAGVLFGRVQAKAPSVTVPAALAPAVDVAGPYASSGPFGLQGGMRLGYRFTRNVGVVVTPLANVMMSDFLFNLDLTGGLQLAF